MSNENDEERVWISRRRDYKSGTAKEFERLRKSGERLDCNIKCGDRLFPCHEELLAGNCPKLAALIRASKKSGSTPQIEMNLPESVVEILLDFMYIGFVSIPHDTLPRIGQAAYNFGMRWLRDTCICEAVIKPSNVILWYKFANDTSNDDLRHRCFRTLFRPTTLPQVSKCPAFLELSDTEIITLVRDAERYEAKFADSLDAVIGWIDHKPQERGKCLNDLVNKLNLTACPSKCLEKIIKDHANFLLQYPDTYNELMRACGKKLKGTEDKNAKILGGHNRPDHQSPAFNKTCWEFTPSTNFVEVSEIPSYARSYGFAVCTVPGGFVVTGSCSCAMFDMSTKSWTQMSQLPLERSKHGSIYRQGKIFVFGGFRPTESSDSVQSLVLEGGTKWMDESELPKPTYCPEVVDSKAGIYLLNVHTNMLYHYDLLTTLWSKLSRVPDNICFGARMVCVQDLFMIIGGIHQMCHIYNHSTDTWGTGKSPIHIHVHGALTAQSQKLFLIGGEENNQIEEYSLETESWSLCHTEVPTKLENLHACTLME